jgi:microcystin-dependent protein
MATPYVGEIRQFAGNFAPVGWAFCNGQLMSIAQNDVLFALIGTIYGGDGQSTFALPNLQGRVPIHQGTFLGTPYVLGQLGGTETVTLITGQIPAHTHTPLSAASGTSPSPTGNVWATTGNGSQVYGPAPGSIALNTKTIGNTGGSLPHENRMPYVAVSYIISFYGVFPSPS